MRKSQTWQCKYGMKIEELHSLKSNSDRFVHCTLIIQCIIRSYSSKVGRFKTQIVHINYDNCAHIDLGRMHIYISYGHPTILYYQIEHVMITQQSVQSHTVNWSEVIIIILMHWKEQRPISDGQNLFPTNTKVHILKLMHTYCSK